MYTDSELEAMTDTEIDNQLSSSGRFIDGATYNQLLEELDYREALEDNELLCNQ